MLWITGPKQKWKCYPCFCRSKSTMHSAFTIIIYILVTASSSFPLQEETLDFFHVVTGRICIRKGEYDCIRFLTERAYSHHVHTYYQFTVSTTVLYGKSGLNHMRDKLGRYRATRPILMQLGQYDSANNDDVISRFFTWKTCFNRQFKHKFKLIGPIQQTWDP